MMFAMSGVVSQRTCISFALVRSLLMGIGEHKKIHSSGCYAFRQLNLHLKICIVQCKLPYEPGTSEGHEVWFLLQFFPSRFLFFSTLI
jgi:hypothetical protein